MNFLLYFEFLKILYKYCCLFVQLRKFPKDGNLYGRFSLPHGSRAQQLCSPVSSPQANFVKLKLIYINYSCFNGERLLLSVNATI